MASHIGRRKFLATLGGAAAVAWPLTARAQRRRCPSTDSSMRDRPMRPLPRRSARALNEAGYLERQNVTVEYHWLEGQFDRLPALMAELVRRRVAVIATPDGNLAALAAKAATTTTPIVFGVGEGPVKLGLVTSLARPGGNLTGINFFAGQALDRLIGPRMEVGRLVSGWNGEELDLALPLKTNPRGRDRASLALGSV
jgi:putative ABC transport system substrate-binding protein